MSRRGSALVIVLAIIVVAVVAIGAWVFFSHQSGSAQSQAQPASTTSNIAGIDPQKAEPLIQMAIQQYSNSSELSIVPTPFTISQVDTTGYPSYSYYGMTFSAPWKSQPVIQVSQPSKLMTLLHFSNNKEIVEAFASSSSISPIAGGALSSYLSGLEQNSLFTSSAWKSLYGSALQSNYDFISASLESGPNQLSLDSADIATSTLSATGLLPTKADLFKFLGQDILPTQSISAIYSFSNSSVRGFEFIGTVTNGTTTQPVAHFLFFDSQDQPFNLLTVGATQSEDNFILSTLKAE